jgi:hypothetical protein
MKGEEKEWLGLMHEGDYDEVYEFIESQKGFKTLKKEFKKALTRIKNLEEKNEKLKEKIMKLKNKNAQIKIKSSTQKDKAKEIFLADVDKETVRKSKVYLKRIKQNLELNTWYTKSDVKKVCCVHYKYLDYCLNQLTSEGILETQEANGTLNYKLT